MLMKKAARGRASGHGQHDSPKRPRSNEQRLHAVEGVCEASLTTAPVLVSIALALGLLGNPVHDKRGRGSMGGAHKLDFAAEGKNGEHLLKKEDLHASLFAGFYILFLHG